MSTSIALVVCSMAIAAGAFWWRSAVFRAPPPQRAGEPWEQVKEDYPMSWEAASIPKLSPEVIDRTVRANPFSSKRHLPPPSPEGTASTVQPGAVTEPPAAEFAYKGRITLGKSQRAILENLATHKTYFLQVGQEVAGFKVLDIDESRVVLSHPQTHEEIVVSLLSAEKPSP